MENNKIYRFRIFQDTIATDGDGWGQTSFVETRDEYYRTYEGACKRFDDFYDNRETFKGVSGMDDVKYTNSEVPTHYEDNELKKIHLFYDVDDGFATKCWVDIIVTEEDLK